MIQATQVGYICISETPEGGNLGLLKNLGITSIISLERKLDLLIEVLGKPEYNEKIISYTHIEGWIPFMISGIFYYWCAPGDKNNSFDIMGRRKTSIEEMLVKERRYGKLPYDSCIVYNHVDNILEYFCDSSRPMRPLLLSKMDN